MEDWIRNCETLMGEDADGSPCPLLTEFEVDQSPHSLLQRLEDFLADVAPSQALIDGVRDLMIDDVMTKTVDRIISTWSTPTVTPDAQRSLHERTHMMVEKARFLIYIFTELLQSDEWTQLHRSVYVAANDVLLAAMSLGRKYPHNPSDFIETLFHFEVRSLGRFCQTAWSGLISRGDEDVSSFMPTSSMITKVPTDLLIPTMRRLGMMDLLDPDWNMYGAWDEILEEMTRCGDEPISKTHADKTLEEKSVLWRNARNSIACRSLSKSRMPGMRFMPPAPQCFEYFPKCSVKKCSNIESREKPHRHRCTKCYYFHFCSSACEQYADAFDLHDCDLTPPDKVADIKRETEAYLGWDRKRGADNESKLEKCNFCGTTRANAPRGVLLKCQRCKDTNASVAYCDRSCQEWDWPSHRGVCKKWRTLHIC